jgi:hypothetical protein
MATVESAKVAKDRQLDPAQASLSSRRFRDQLVQALAPVLNDEIYELYKKAYALAEAENKKWARVFQDILRECGEWDDDYVREITERVVAIVPWFRVVVRQVVVQEIFVMMSTRYDRAVDDVNFEFELPANEQLVHSILKHVCHHMRGYVSLYSHEVDDETVRVHNTGLAEEQIQKALQPAIASIVPIKKIVEAHLTPPPPPPKEGNAEEKMTMLQSEQPVSDSAAASSDTPQHPAHVEIVERKEALAAAAANDATVAAQEAMQSAQLAMSAAKEAEEAVDKKPKKHRRPPLKSRDF